ncbi:hypothetical protein Q0M94_25125 (plasmid) [Deinococcus radiomollis]|uniref:Ig-like domain-containing protein n=1 Tax=Deinococcus radiomollis TaxID=468916 RepID=UPI0038911C4B
MKKTLLILPLTAALLAACQGTPVPVTLNTLTLGGVSSTLQVSAPAKLTVTATGSDGNPYTDTATFTSSDPSVVAVASDGTLTVRHLSTAPVVLTVNEAGKTASMTVTTYGLDVAGGTYIFGGTPNAAPGYNFILALTNADGTAVKTDTTVTIQGPATFNGGAALPLTVNNATVNNYVFSRRSTVPIVTGTYTATATVGGVVYSKTFTVDAAQIQPFAGGVALNVTKTGYAASGTLPAGSPLVYGVVVAQDSSIVSTTDFFSALPKTGNLTAPLVVGQQYYYGVYAQSYIGTSGKPFPDQVNRSFIYVGSSTITQ